MSEFDDLRAAAEAVADCDGEDVEVVLTAAEDRFYTAASPDVVLALIARVEAAEAAVARVRELIPEVLDDHAEEDMGQGVGCVCGWSQLNPDLPENYDAHLSGALTAALEPISDARGSDVWGYGVGVAELGGSASSVREGL